MRSALLLTGLLAITLTACGKARGPYTSTAEQRRDIAAAERIYQHAVQEIADRDFASAETLLREALTQDLYHGPAHNNLGVILLQQGKLYDAAEEFEWSRKLMPGHPEPRVNLAITLERGGRHQDALEAAQSALDVRPGHLGALKAVAWISIQEGQGDQSTLDHLDAIIARAEEPTWQSWARQERIRLAAKLSP